MAGIRRRRYYGGRGLQRTKLNVRTCLAKDDGAIRNILFQIHKLALALRTAEQRAAECGMPNGGGRILRSNPGWYHRHHTLFKEDGLNAPLALDGTTSPLPGRPGLAGRSRKS
jgi:hypothetical protein